MERSYEGHLRLAVMAALLVGVALAFVGLHLALPFANGRLQPGTETITARGVMVTPVEGGPAGLEAGDVVTAVNGRSLEAWLADPGRLGQMGETVRLTVLRAEEETEVTVTLGPYPLGTIVRREWGALVFRLIYLLVATYVYARRPQVAAARVLFLAAAAQFSAIPWSIGVQAGDFVNGIGLWLYLLGITGGFMLSWIAALHFALIFPRPLPVLKRQRRLLPLLYGLPYTALVVYILYARTQAANALVWIRQWEWFTGPHSALYLSLTAGALVWQFRRHRHGPARQQMRWLGLGGLIVASAAVLFYFLPLIAGSRALDVNVMGLIGLLFPVTVAIAILRHNLFDIDTLLNRALVYGSLTATIITLYVLVVGVLGTALQAQGDLFLALVATGLAAVLFQPLRDRLQKGVNRMMYGERDEPFDVLARLGERLESTLSPEMVYPAIVETVSQALKLPYTAVAVWRKGELVTVESFGKPVADPVTYTLAYRGEAVGQLQVARRAPDEPFSAADERILRNLARQAGAAVHAVQLLADLQRSRQQLVTAREEERRRLRRDLHDGLGPQLASQTLTIDAINKLLTRDPERARALLQDLKTQSQAAVQDIRRLVYALRPPALDELGLTGALREGFTRQSENGLQIRVEAPSPLPPLPAAVEVAAYRVAQEAVTNVVRHARATTCTVQLAIVERDRTDALYVAVEDDGRGLRAEYRAGVGMQSMRERAAELGGTCEIESRAGGGVCVTAVFPLAGGTD